MAPVSKVHQDMLSKIKDHVKDVHEGFRNNIRRFNEFRKFVFSTSLSESDISVLDRRQMPKLEFNIMEAYVSRLCGEFSKHEPSYMVGKADDVENVDPALIKLIEGNLRAKLSDVATDNFRYEIYRDMLTGGYSVGKVKTEYLHGMSMSQDIFIERVKDPTLCGFDLMATKSHKGDGEFCFETFPIKKEELKEMVSADLMKKITFSRDFEGFSWSYKNGIDDIALICDFYYKKKKKTKIVQITGGKVMTMDAYNKSLEEWASKGMIEQPPAITSERYTMIERVCRYRVCEAGVIDYQETDYRYLPLVFFDGNSIMLRNNTGGSIEQLTRPYLYHAIGVQKLKNFAGQCLANELENMVMHKFMAPIETIPDLGQEAWRNVQKADVLLYNAYKDNNPDMPLPKPEAIPRVGAPPEVIQAFSMSDQVTQAILGSFDANISRLPSEGLSGVAIQESATLNNAAAMPYLVGFIRGLNQIANIYVDLAPKYMVTARTIPTMDTDGRRGYQKVNQEGGIDIGYDSNSLHVKVEAGVNFEIQKSTALKKVVALMQASPLFAEFMNTEGMSILLDNLDIRGIDGLKEKADEWMKQMQAQKAAQQKQTQQMPNPAMAKIQLEQSKIQQQAQANQAKTALDQQKLQAEQQKSTQEYQLKVAGLEQSQQGIDNDTLKIHADIAENAMDVSMERDKASAEKARAAAEMHLDHADMMHDHLMDHANHHLEVIETHHNLTKGEE